MAELITTALTALQKASKMLEEYKDNEETKGKLLKELSSMQEVLRNVEGLPFSTHAGIQDLLHDSGRTLRDLDEQLKNLPTGILCALKVKKRLEGFTDRIRDQRHQLSQGCIVLTLRITHAMQDEMAQLRQACAAAEKRARDAEERARDAEERTRDAEERTRHAEERARAAEREQAQLKYLRQKITSSSGWYTQGDLLAWLNQSEELTSRAHS